MATLFTATVPSHHRFISQHPPKQSLPKQSLSVTLTWNREPAAAVSLQEQQTTDWMAPLVSRRFGIGAGLTWSGFLAFGVVSEQMKKSRLEVFHQEDNTRGLEMQEEIILPNGIRYYDLRAGSGASPSSGYLVVFDVKGQVHGTKQVFVDTFGSKDKKKSLAMVMDSRPYSKGLCEGIEHVLRSMKAGGKRRVIIPPSLGFGSKNVDFGLGLQIPPSATLDYIIEIVFDYSSCGMGSSLGDIPSMGILQWGGDQRFDEQSGNLVRLIIFWTLQAVLVWTVSLPLTIVNASDGGGSL